MPENTSPIDFSDQGRQSRGFGQATAEPVTLIEALIAQAEHLPSLRMMVGPLCSDTFSAACASNISFLSYGVIGNVGPCEVRATRCHPEQLQRLLCRLRHTAPQRRCRSGAACAIR